MTGTTVAAARPVESAWSSLTLRRWKTSMAWTLAILVLGGLGHLLDRFVLRFAPDQRMFDDPAEVVTRILGYPHYVIALLFALTAHRARAPRARARFLALLAAGAAIVALFHVYARDYRHVVVIAFTLWFVLHAFADEAHFYAFREGADPATRGRDGLVVKTLSIVVACSIFAVLTPIYLEKVYARGWVPLDPWVHAYFAGPFPLWARVAVFLVPGALLGALAVRRLARAYPGGIPALWVEHRPLILLFGLHWLLLITALAISFYVFILVHFVTWYVFAVERIRSAGPRPRVAGGSGRLAALLERTKRTASGFHALHLGLIAVSAVVVGVLVYGLRQQGALNDVFGEQSFYYWTVLHLATSLAPK